ncbi:MAG: hypothetical protein MRY79_05535 [Alphaproteobacteria bacterium]|nr:hypothetical protein [Alphaproteobacteria bacterium]
MNLLKRADFVRALKFPDMVADFLDCALYFGSLNQAQLAKLHKSAQACRPKVGNGPYTEYTRARTKLNFLKNQYLTKRVKTKENAHENRIKTV